MPTISTQHGLEAFRVDWSGEHMLDQLQRHGGKGLIDWAIGVGKSTNIDHVIEAAVSIYQLVIVLLPTIAVTEERRWVREPPAGIRIEVLDPRPAKRCGKARDAEWRGYETRNLGLLGRHNVCTGCPHRASCKWPGQFGKYLVGSRVIFARQAHLERDPAFISNLKFWTRTDRVLVIMDEDRAVLKTFRRQIGRADLQRFCSVLGDLLPAHHQFQGWRDLVHALVTQQHAQDLRCPDWKFPYLPPEDAALVQQRGDEMFPGHFIDIHHLLREFGRSAYASRQIGANGTIEFAVRLRLDRHDDLLVYSGSAIPEFLEFRLGVKLANLSGGVSFHHPGTTWINIASRLGAARNFPGNADQVLDFFAALVAQRLHEGRRPLLVSKKKFDPLCAQEMTRRLKSLGFSKIKVVTGNWHRQNLKDPNVLPLIHYGVIGINLFQGFDAAYCLNSFNTRVDVINSVVQDVLADDHAIPLQILTAGRPLRRRVVITDPQHRGCDVESLANHALHLQEIEMVLQAVGRVRPFTRPREIITFQAADHPNVVYDHEFNTVGEARRHFSIGTARQTRAQRTMGMVMAARARGFSQAAAVQDTGLSLRTIKRHWNRSTGATNPSIYL